MFILCQMRSFRKQIANLADEKRHYCCVIVSTQMFHEIRGRFETGGLALDDGWTDIEERGAGLGRDTASKHGFPCTLKSGLIER